LGDREVGASGDGISMAGLCEDVERAGDDDNCRGYSRYGFHPNSYDFCYGFHPNSKFSQEIILTNLAILIKHSLNSIVLLQACISAAKDNVKRKYNLSKQLKDKISKEIPSKQNN
jgi:hypothetical protein